MFLGGHDAFGNLRPGILVVGVEVAQLEAGNEQTTETPVKVGLFHFATPDGFGQMLILRATLHVGACQDGLGTGLRAVPGNVVPAGKEVANGATVAGNQSVETPLVAQDLLFITGLGTAGLSVNALVGTHHLGHLALLHQCLESREIGFPEVALWQVFYIELMAVPLRPAVYGEVLGAGQQLAVLAHPEVFALIAHTLQATHHGKAHPGGQVRVFAVGLLTASPAGVTKDVDVGSPERQALIAFDVAGTLCLLRLYAGLVADGSKDLMEQSVVPRCCHSHRNREYGGIAVAAYAMQGFVPPLELRNAETRNGRRRVHHQTDFLFECQSCQQIVSPLLRAKAGILIG